MVNTCSRGVQGRGEGEGTAREGGEVGTERKIKRHEKQEKQKENHHAGATKKQDRNRE